MSSKIGFWVWSPIPRSWTLGETSLLGSSLNFWVPRGRFVDEQLPRRRLLILLPESGSWSDESHGTRDSKGNQEGHGCRGWQPDTKYVSTSWGLRFANIIHYLAIYCRRLDIKVKSPSELRNRISNHERSCRSASSTELYPYIPI